MDVGRVLDVPYADVDRIAKMIPATLDATLEKAIDEVPQLREAAEADPRIGRLLDVAKRLEGVSRHASTHAAGVVIAPKPLTEFLPLYKGNRGEITTQYAMKDVEDIGLLKMDFLGLRTLTLLDNCVKLIARQLGEKIELDRLPMDNPKTYQLFSEGQTFGIFQFESDGMRDILRRFKPEKLSDLTALNALYRPGPIRSGMIDDFIKRKHGKVPVRYEVPELKEILEDTLGVMVYQEQVMRIGSTLAGFTLGEADLLRKAHGEEKGRRDAGPAGKVHIRRGGERDSEEEGGENLRAHGAFSAAMGSIAPTRRLMRFSLTKRPTSRLTIRSSSWPRY